MTHSFRFAATGVRAKGPAVLLAIDNHSLPLAKNLCLYLSKPEVRAEPVLGPSRENPAAPDALATHFYGTVLLDGDKFRMWYYPVNLGPNLDWPPELQSQLETHTGDTFGCSPCYAESEDGIHWVKPALGQILFKGTRQNNALSLPQVNATGVTVIRDDPDPDPARRFKMVYGYYDHRLGAVPAHRQSRLWGAVRTAVSADGLHWTPGPCLGYDEFVEHSSFCRFDDLYIVHAQKGGHWGRSEGGHGQGRQGFAWVSPDFDHWLAEYADSFTLPEPHDPEARGQGNAYDQVHLGVGAYSYGNVLVGLYGLWHNRAVFGENSADFGLVLSNDGLHFREPVKGHVYLAAGDSPATPLPGKEYPTVLCQANGVLNSGDETRIYHGRWRNARNEDYAGEVALATLPRDRWGALGLFPDAAQGSLWSAPVTLPDGDLRLTLNADGAAGMTVELADERFNLIPAFSGEHCGHPLTLGGLDCPVKWPLSDLSALAGQTVRLHIGVQRQGDVEPRLYVLYLGA